MKRLLFACTALAALIPASTALAADPPLAPVYAPPPVPIFTWTGFYFGGNVGGAWGNSNVSESIGGQNWNMTGGGFIGGGQLGFNYQFGPSFLGIEWDADWTSLNASGASVVVPGIGTLQGSVDTKWMTTVAARFGVAFGQSVFYGKAGAGWVGTTATITNLTTGNSLSASSNNSGLLLGAGFEFAFTPNWSAKIEYDYLALRNWTPAIQLQADTFTFERDIQMLKVGVNYKFGWGYPVSARY
jgi:outer membrane immunogenic protein